MGRTGDRTVDEMGHAWVNVTYITDQDYQDYVARTRQSGRRTRAARRSSRKNKGAARPGGLPHFAGALLRNMMKDINYDMRRDQLRAAGVLPWVLGQTAHGQDIGPPMEEPVHAQGDNITGAFEGWFENPDGTFSLLVGYYNRNVKQILDIPVGPNNRIEPGGPDQGQPTHFLSRRQWGMFRSMCRKISAIRS